jgi:hypothetical protein
MINLLPAQQKKLVKRWYMLRALSVALGALIIMTALGALLFIPTLVTINSRYIIARNQIELLESTGTVASPVDIAGFDARSAALLAKLASARKTPPTEYIALLRDVAPDGVSPTGFAAVSGDTPQQTITGFANSREQLQVYVMALEALPSVAVVDAPISNYVGSKNVEFSITVTFKE